jgi:CPA2 family monovalent cation:H+ antiporter-2
MSLLTSSMTDIVTLQTLAPIIVFLFLGVAAAMGSRAFKVSPIVGYIVLGLALQVAGFGDVFKQATIEVLAELGVMFLLFDIGLHFSLGRVRQQAFSIFAFGFFQVLFATLALAAAAFALGLAPLPALLVGAILSLSSTAVVARLIAERHQVNCPVGTTATSILVFQDIAAIFLLIIAGALGGSTSIGFASAMALLKAAIAFAATIAVARLLVRPVLNVVARSKNEEVFTATALFIALAAGWLTGRVGLSVTLGAFLGGVALAETPYKPVVASEVKPFRGLLLGFFFVSIGLSLDVQSLASSLPAVLGATALLLLIKTVSNIAASRLFRWSVPGSTQLGFLLAQGSEFAFVILALPVVRQIVGESAASIIMAAVTLSIAVTPNVAEAGRALAGKMRMRIKKRVDAELTPLIAAAPVIIVGMGTTGRMVADALRQFKIPYFAIERDERRLELALADGYDAAFGDGFDLRLWESLELHERKLSVLTVPDYEVLKQTAALIEARYPQLKRFAVIKAEAEASALQSLGLNVILDQTNPPGLAVVAAVLKELAIAPSLIDQWIHDRTPSAPAIVSLVGVA